MSQKGQWESWVRFFLSGAAEQSLDAVRRAARLRELRDEDHARILAEATGRARNRIFAADGIIRAIEEDLPPAED